ncbi:aminoglycoside phosphotransferase family protein [Streptomyces ochraceiscleroticus]|uniref:Aminoglycoside phosphotransferase family protein n=1 Tax=Streptomyces ochraceiscleroticus TaxID=47761 RepID=A0ABW1MQ77_9ACTN|nr:aminoglycoside phosphotransferase family protein [Streptomyces ochraceiscleroticus]
MANPSPDSSGTPLSERAERAVRIAVRAARRLGLRADAPRVLHDVFNVLVHLAPDPVVVRVPSLALVSAEEQTIKQRRELDVAGWLADTGAPVVRPSPLVPREPVACEGRSLTFWEFVDEKDPLREAVAAGPEALEDRFVEQTGWTAQLHGFLARYPGELPVLSPVVPTVEPLLAALRKEPQGLTTADLDRAEQEYAVLEALAADLPGRFPGARIQPLHGDGPSYNLLRTAEGHLFSDFEDVTSGPVEWDLAMVGPRAAAEYERVSGHSLDRALLDVMERARLLQVVGALAVVPSMPELGPMLAPMVDQWRERPPLGPDLLVR